MSDNKSHIVFAYLIKKDRHVRVIEILVRFVDVHIDRQISAISGSQLRRTKDLRDAQSAEKGGAVI